jgi:hypothetical protein
MKVFRNPADRSKAFPNEKAVFRHLKAMPWKDGTRCPQCGCKKIYCIMELGLESGAIAGMLRGYVAG